MDNIIGKTIVDCQDSEDGWLRLNFSDESSVRFVFWGRAPNWLVNVSDIFGRSVRAVEIKEDHWIVLLDNWQGFACIFRSQDIVPREIYVSQDRGADEAPGDAEHPVSARGLERILAEPFQRLSVMVLDGPLPPFKCVLRALPEGSLTISGATLIRSKNLITSVRERVHHASKQRRWTEIELHGALPRNFDMRHTRLRLDGASSSPGAIAWPARVLRDRCLTTSQLWAPVDDKEPILPIVGDHVVIEELQVVLGGMTVVQPFDCMTLVQNLIVGAVNGRGGTVILTGCIT